MENRRRSLGTIILQIALGLMFIVSGIWTLQNGRGDEVASAIRSIFNSDIARTMCLVFGIIEIIAGIFLLLRLFVRLNTNLDTLLMIIILLCWIIAIVMIDFVGNDGLFNNLNENFLRFINRFAKHLLVLGAIIMVKE